MSKNYKQTIQLNNTDLQTILTTISELPEAGNSDPVLQDKTVTPTKSQQTVTADSAYDGLNQVTVLSIPNEYITTTDATAVAETVFKDETAYVDGKKLTGTFTIDSELTTQDNLISQIQTALQGKAAGGGGASVETCTIEIINETLGKRMESYIIDLWFIAYENGEFKGYGGIKDWDSNNIWPANFDPKAQKNIINNVVCNSMMYITDFNTALTPPQDWYINPAIDHCFLKIPSTPNVTHTLKLEVPF